MTHMGVNTASLRHYNGGSNLLSGSLDDKQISVDNLHAVVRHRDQHEMYINGRTKIYTSPVGEHITLIDPNILPGPVPINPTVKMHPATWFGF